MSKSRSSDSRCYVNRVLESNPVVASLPQFVGLAFSSCVVMVRPLRRPDRSVVCKIHIMTVSTDYFQMYTAPFSVINAAYRLS
jgi:hypothetical protein